MYRLIRINRERSILIGRVTGFNGGGLWISVRGPRGWLMIDVRPLSWRFAYVRPDGKPYLWRLYVGPIIIEGFQ